VKVTQYIEIVIILSAENTINKYILAKFWKGTRVREKVYSNPTLSLLSPELVEGARVEGC